jgi:hypothetical protein
MGFRYRKSLRLSRGMRLNLTKRGISSVSVGRRGSTIIFGQKGARGTFGIPGSGMSYSSRRTSASAVLPALIIAIFGGILIAAIRGNRLAQLALVVIVVPCVVSILIHHTTEQTEALSVKVLPQDRLQIEARVGTPDGIWGVRSQVALDEFRRKHRLSGTAPWDLETQAALFSEITVDSGSDLEVGRSEAAAKASSLR